MDDLLWSLVRRSLRTDEIRFNEVLARTNMGRTKLLSLSSSSYIPCLSVAFPPILDDLFGRHVGRDFPYTIIYIYIYKDLEGEEESDFTYYNNNNNNYQICPYDFNLYLYIYIYIYIN